MRRSATVLLALLIAVFSGGLGAQESITIDNLNLGTYWFGPEITKADLAGKVVLVEMWGS